MLEKIQTGFDQFDLDDRLMRGIKAAGFESPRTIQLQTIPAGRDGRDVLGLAQTGTGKTAAFGLALLDRLLQEQLKGPRALILAPTRELAAQITEEIRMLSRFTQLTTVTVYGGVSLVNQVRALRKHPDIVVGCPGRVLDLINQNALDLGRVETLVLDEADHMFDMGFLPDIRKILKSVPSRRQNLFFSATMPKELRGLADAMLRNPHIVELVGKAPAKTIDHAMYRLPQLRKQDLLEHILGGDGCDSVIVFTRTKHRARRLADRLKNSGHEAIALQGNMSQQQRDRAMRGFRNRQYSILVATDIASRGIDVTGVSHVINFDVPSTPEAYTHRIGRTGRSEQEGIALTFVTPEDGGWLRSTERMIGSPIPQLAAVGFEAAPRTPAEPRPKAKTRTKRRPGKGVRAAKGSVRGGRGPRPAKAESTSVSGHRKPSSRRRRRARRPSSAASA